MSIRTKHLASVRRGIALPALALSVSALLLLGGCAAPKVEGSPAEGSPEPAVQTPDAAQTPSASQQPSSVTPQANGYISEAQAIEAALAHASIAQADARFMQVGLEHDDGRHEFDVEFYANGVEYDYTIDATTGGITSFDNEAEFIAAAKQQRPAANGDLIDNEAAIAAALAHASIAQADATHLRSHFDYDDGRPVYDVEFYVGYVEYSYEIDASSGAVIEYDIDRD